MQNTIRTVYGAKLQSTQLLGLSYTADANSTLNEALGIATSQVLAASEVPKVAYVAIGNGGHTMIAGANGIAVPTPKIYKSTNANLYSMLPFVLREVSNDLTQAQQANYALRKTVTINSVSYYAYYLKRLDLSTVQVTMNLNTVTTDANNNSTTTTTAFVPNQSNLTPTAPALSNTGTNVLDGSYVTASALVPWSFTADDVTELENVANIIYGNSAYAIISEVAVCSGVDRNIQASSVNGGNFTFKEAIAVQVNSFLTTFHAMQFSTSGMTLTLDVGATEPLYTSTVVSA